MTHTQYVVSVLRQFQWTGEHTEGWDSNPDGFWRFTGYTSRSGCVEVEVFETHIDIIVHAGDLMSDFTIRWDEVNLIPWIQELFRLIR